MSSYIAEQYNRIFPENLTQHVKNGITMVFPMLNYGIPQFQ